MMKHLWITLGIAAAMMSSAVSAEPQTQPRSANDPAPRVKKVLIIGIDGCRPDALLAANAPHLKGLIAAGAFSDQTQTGEDTVSGPGWSSMLTGVWANKHGVRNNEFRNPNYDKYPHFFRRLKAVQPELTLESIVQWAPIHEKIVSGADHSVAARTDALVAEGAVKVLSQQDPDVLFLHFDEVDGAGHSKGFHPTVPEYMQAIEQTDEYVGKVLEALKARPTYNDEDWLILSSTDHGGKGTGHGGGAKVPEIRTIFLIVSGPSALSGKIETPTYIVDVAATAIAHLGVDIADNWEFDGKPAGLKSR
jgi:predicted AlkP superfamily pyrophosphatase or phosphodiesterase